MKKIWSKEEDKLSMFAEHNELEKVTTSLVLLEENIENGQFNEENFNNKKKYLITKVKNLLDLSKYDEMVKYYLEYSTLLDYYQEFKKQKKSFQLDNTKKLIFMMDGSKSLIQKYLELCKTKYQGPILKNLLDIEKEKKLLLPDFCYKNNYLYIKDEFVVKVVYTYLDSGYVLVLGVLDKNMKIETFISNNKKLLDKTLTNKNDLVIDNSERDLILKNIKVEDLVLTIDLNTLDVKMEEENAR